MTEARQSRRAGIALPLCSTAVLSRAQEPDETAFTPGPVIVATRRRLFPDARPACSIPELRDERPFRDRQPDETFPLPPVSLPHMSLRECGSNGRQTAWRSRPATGHKLTATSPPARIRPL